MTKFSLYLQARGLRDFETSSDFTGFVRFSSQFVSWYCEGDFGSFHTQLFTKIKVKFSLSFSGHKVAMIL
jgi:hypothetical protein